MSGEGKEVWSLEFLVWGSLMQSIFHCLIVLLGKYFCNQHQFIEHRLLCHSLLRSVILFIIELITQKGKRKLLQKKNSTIKHD